ncbi:MAG: hypothetical protein B6D57_00435 [Candidatus Coatesbacteria bacterium 4484_99]|uniref:Electron transfer flavoprotein alpha/beta-subunit N-terminal domain-containing protein n=1 Tax=Candidatus Coatesbacteria bacterium 4484_99 TaxID=1970774 RepID=A0A1W9S3G1_9BACT|nr:MAG: hypothetical protein B6D57_00435 [Candidatus Coatesbacteria bacterium 4484_99]RLC43391.1 MAG: electron transfer flavoprotein subunit alpha/FixB family protein [Candidatus Coatesbacteria bacterium]RLC44880.1 MAG: electron transfer flavoprotein subunit alpha/FixB family protein [Candidatus Coatesbacteria bacterium]
MKVYVFIEHNGEAVRKPCLELIGGARKHLPEAEITAMCAGQEIPDRVRHLPVDNIIHIKSDALTDYTSERHSYAISEALKNSIPDIILISATFQGRDLAPRLSAKLNIPLISECTGINVDNSNINLIHPMFGGRAIASVSTTKDEPFIATIRPNAFPSVDGEGNPQIEEVKVDIPDDIQTVEVLSVEDTTGDMPDVAEAPIVVSGGRGMKGPENFKMLEELAKVLGGAVGASRSAVDEGWMPQSHQVGQTGKTISPNLYIACGISGAIQHRAGMSSSKCIVAINTDPEAEIFKIADYGIVSDLFKIVPLMIEKLS